jgi:outer membrane protein assembly factor BamB
VYSQHQWPMFHSDPLHTGYSPSPGPTRNDTLWVFDTQHDIFGPSPSVADGLLYISGGYGTFLYALNATTGDLVWNHTRATWIASSPAVAYGQVYFGGFDKNVTALNATDGGFLWNYTTMGWLAASSPAVADGVVYIGGGYGDTVLALNASTGDKLWEYLTGGDVHSSPAVANGIVYVGSYDDRVYALNATTGEEVWIYPTGYDVFSSPAVVEGVVYVGSNDNKVYALDAVSGTELWNYPTENWVSSSPAVGDGMVYVGSYDGNVYTLNATTGVKLWNYTTGGAISSSPALSSNGVVYIGSGDNRTYALNAQTGQVIWTYEMGNDAFSSPAIAEGVVYTASRDGKVYAIQGSLQTFSIAAGAETYPVTILSGSSLANLQFSQQGAQITFDVIGPKAMDSFCNVTVPKTLMQGPWTVELDGSNVTFTTDDNGDVTTLSFAYSHASTHSITIVASWVVPEFPTTPLTTLLLTATLAIAILARLLPKPRSENKKVLPLSP